ncbi:MAG TPA: hypothetical protein VFG49_12555, partial [Dyella sp.]|uniref:hypothetical protein n=1 Tax=Dyella sp. TaxID=1869338 RepID=UPI002D78F856
DSYVDLTLYEQDDEGFAITASVEHGQHVTDYNPTSINAFRKQGNWAQLLIICEAAIIEQKQKSSAQMSYYKADEIKDRFKE